jgi:Holliday junction resolvase-like predicted endonuclease
MDMRFARIRRNVKVKGFGEYDIVADDEGRVLVIEVKNKLSKRLVDEFMQKNRNSKRTPKLTKEI